MLNDKAARRLESKKGETRSRTQNEPERKMSYDEDRFLERKEKETWRRTQEGKMFDDEVRHLERKEKEKEAVIRRKRLEESRMETKAFVEAQQV